ncbi:MAG: hypothetical protein K2I81_03395 [Alphaproteobacteria bacterium]|nr:hypothetical protein [Alphaproteobacteria bacterium]
MVDVYIINLSGFMLGTDKDVLRPGQKWLPYDAEVYVCRNIDVAKRLLQLSQRGFIDGINPVWTTIYHVVAPMVKCTRADNAMLWTPDASKIIVDRPVFQQPPRQLPEAALFDNAKAQLSAFMRLMNLSREETK